MLHKFILKYYRHPAHPLITSSFFPNASTTACIPRWISFGRNSKQRHENNHRPDECEGNLCSAREINPGRNREHTRQHRRFVVYLSNLPGVLFVIGASPLLCDEFFLEVFSFYFYERTNPRGEWQKPR